MIYFAMFIQLIKVLVFNNVLLTQLKIHEYKPVAGTCLFLSSVTIFPFKFIKMNPLKIHNDSL